MLNQLKIKFYQHKLNFLTLKNPFFKIDQNTKNKLKGLNYNGYFYVGNVLSSENIAKLKKIIDLKIDNCEAKFIEEQNIWKISKLDDFEYILTKIFTQNLHDLIKSYFQRNIYLSDFDIRRVLPTTVSAVRKYGKSNSDWHKDIRGKQIKIMIYLSNVTKQDSYLSLIPKTHHVKTYDFNESRLNDNYVEKKKIYNFLANEGDAILFDTNIIHRLNRQPLAAVRDSITFYFTPGQSLKKIFKNNLSLKLKNYKYSEILSEPFFLKRD